MRHLKFFRSSIPPPPPPHAPIERTLIPSKAGDLEILSAIPGCRESKHAETPLFFVHGWFGCASMWTDYMIKLSNAPYHIPCYAISLRGHGASWCPNYLRMVYGTGKRQLTDDVVTGIKYVEQKEAERRHGEFSTLVAGKVILVAHSLGGGLAQMALDRGEVQVRGLALLDSVPNKGVAHVYLNWMMVDRLFIFRFFGHVAHPKSPLASTQLVKKAFFSDQISDCLVRRFETLMAAFESLLWPWGLFFRFVSLPKVLDNVLACERRPGVLIMAAEHSTLLGEPLMKSMADEYQEAVDERFYVDSQSVSPGSDNTSPTRSMRLPDAVGRVWYYVVKGAGHHLQNDLQWEDGAIKLGDFYNACCSYVCLPGHMRKDSDPR